MQPREVIKNVTCQSHASQSLHTATENSYSCTSNQHGTTHQSLIFEGSNTWNDVVKGLGVSLHAVPEFKWTGTAVQQQVSGTDVKQWWSWMNGHKQWFSNGYQEETWNNDDIGWTVRNTVNLGYNITSGVSCKDCLYLRITKITF
jgi:hypothetical protein